MTRTIKTAAELDALPVGSVVRTARGDVATRHESDRGTVLGWLVAGYFGPQVLYADTDLPATVLHDPSAPATGHVCTTHCEQGKGHYPAPVVPVVSDAAVARGLAQSAAGETVDLGDFTQYLIPDAAVEAAARAIHAEGWTCEAHEPMGLDECEQCATSTPRLARAALSAALPFLGAAPSATREDLEEAIFEADDEYALEVHEVRALASRLFARFTITPKAGDATSPLPVVSDAAVPSATHEGDGPCSITEPHGPHRWDTEDRVHLRRECPGTITPRTDR